MTKRIVARTLWMARGTATMMGLVVMVAVVLGIATTANAAAGDPLKLGKLNTVNKLTQLVGGFEGAMLRIDNNSAGVGATALRLEVEPGKPPMSVNSTTEVSGLNADQVDSLSASAFLQESSDRDDFLPSKTYNTLGGGHTLADGQTGFAEARCDPGDVALSGGYNFGFSDSSTVFSTSTGGDRYIVGFGGPRTVVPNVTCADFPPLR
jgi:hypothetical protein